ncbi:hypothetical protein NX059_003892 [Plenodomus lindquistii]|nr:hypothetical protein NX059_003892 [Plenodomus lindquistii]
MDSAQNLSKGAMGRVDWDALNGYKKSAVDRVSTMTGKATETVKQTADSTARQTTDSTANATTKKAE